MSALRRGTIRIVVFAGLLVGILGNRPAHSQLPPVNQGPVAPPVPLVRQNAVLGGINGPAPGGGAQADFDSLIDLIQSTVAPDTWVENGGGQGAIRPFAGGVWIDSEGLMRRVKNSVNLVPAVRPVVASSTDQTLEIKRNAQRDVSLRCISLPALERALARRVSQQQPLDMEMLALAGLERAQYLFVYPKDGDVVLAGPAGGWRIDPFGRILRRKTGRPVVRLDDLLVLMRRARTHVDEPFGCSINPRQDALVAAQRLIDSTRDKPIHPASRDRWLESLRSALGRQDVVFFGIDPGSRTAQTLVSADHHMKLVGMGLAEGVLGVESYLDTISPRPDGSLPPMSVLRWWFSLRYKPVEAGPDRTAYALRGGGVEVLSENELLTGQGKRVHTGRADEATQRFANSFTNNFDRLASKYPIYGELRNVFDLAVWIALLNREDIWSRTGWHAQFLLDERLALPRPTVPREVETVANYRVVNRRHILAGVSGGVWANAAEVAQKVRTQEGTSLEYARATRPGSAPPDAWWWDP